MSSGRPSFAFKRWHAVVPGILLALIALVAAFDWNWLRGPLVDYLQEKSGREVRIDDLDVSFNWHLAPTVRLRGVYVENARWASRQPMARAGEAAFTISPRSLWTDWINVTRLELVDADVSMERKADGLRNWRLTDPEDRGPGTVRVMTLHAERTKFHFLNEGIDFEIRAASAPAKQADDASAAGLPNELSYEGRYQGIPFSGAARIGNFMSFRASGEWFGVRGHLAAGKTRLDVDGRLSDIFDLGPVDARMRLAGDSLSRVHPFLKLRPPSSRPYALEALVRQSAGRWSFTDLKGKVGTADLAGEATYDRSTPRPLATATLHSKSANLLDIAFLAGMDYRNLQRQAGAQRSGGFFPTRAFNTEAMKKFDARIRLGVDKFEMQSVPANSLRLEANLSEGLLKISDLDFGIAGGHVLGTVEISAREAPPAMTASLDGHNLRLERVIETKSPDSMSEGGMRSRLRLSARGKSVAAMAANASGTLTALVNDGNISNLADAKLALNFGKVFGLKLKGDQPIPLYCGAAAFEFKNGVGRSQALLLETEQTHTDGAGVVDLRNQRFELLLTPRPKKPGLFTLNSSIRVQGTFRDAQVKLDDRVPLRDKGAAVAPSTLASLFRPLLPGGRNSACARLLAPVHTATSEN